MTAREQQPKDARTDDPRRPCKEDPHRGCDYGPLPPRRRLKAGYWPALPTVTSVSPRSTVSVGWAPVTGSGWRRMAITVMPALARKADSASVLPIQGLSSGTGIHS